MKVIVANPKGSAEKLSYKESPNGVHTVLKGPKNSLKSTIENAKGLLRKVLRVLTMCKGAVRGLPRDFPRPILRL